VSIGLEGEDVPCWVRGDPGSIARIARVLIDNALRFSPRGERVMVAVANNDGVASMAVTDHGPGIPDDERDLIFDRFKQGSVAGGGSGFGLGLAIGRELAHRMDGDLVCSDTHMGARFELRLPSLAPRATAPVA
jgi:signal transduction histidine kinase